MVTLGKNGENEGKVVFGGKNLGPPALVKCRMPGGVRLGTKVVDFGD
jgi:hypothetical protein